MRGRPLKVAVWAMGPLFLAATIISCGGEQACTPTGVGDEEASSTPAGEESLVPLALIQRGGGGGGGRGAGGGSRSGGGGSKANDSTPRVSEAAPPKASAAANVSNPPSRAQSSYKSHPYSPRYHSSNAWMWFFFAMYIAGDDEPDEEEFEGWIEDQDEGDLTAAEQQYTEEVEGC